MTYLQAIILGIIQGATEFLPISSSGHLVLIPDLLGWDIPAQEAFLFNVLLQVATILAVVAYFWHDLVAIVRGFVAGLLQGKPFEDPKSRLGWMLILASLPAGMAGLFLREVIEQAFDTPLAIALALLVTAGLLMLSEWLGKRQHSDEEIRWRDALVIGMFQALALFPGISRSGSTITGGMLRNFGRRAAARFSFLMAVPITLAAGMLAAMELFQAQAINSHWGIYLSGFIAATVVGYLSIRWLLRYLAHGSYRVFALYCAAFAIFNLVVRWLR